jgi:hypothetical protein
MAHSHTHPASKHAKERGLMMMRERDEKLRDCKKHLLRSEEAEKPLELPSMRNFSCIHDVVFFFYFISLFSHIQIPESSNKHTQQSSNNNGNKHEGESESFVQNLSELIAQKFCK